MDPQFWHKAKQGTIRKLNAFPAHCSCISLVFRAGDIPSAPDTRYTSTIVPSAILSADKNTRTY